MKKNNYSKIFFTILLVVGLLRLAYLEYYKSEMTQQSNNLIESIRSYETNLKMGNDNAVKQSYENGKNSIYEYDKNRILLSKSIGNTTYTAYPLLQIPGSILSTYIIKIVTENDSLSLVSTYHQSLTDAELFEVKGDKLLVVDAQNNTINEYLLNISSDKYSIHFKTSYSVKNYNVGTVYGIKCTDNTCTIRSAFHQESGCHTGLNYTNKSVSMPTCYDYDGTTFAPDLKKIY